MSDTNAPTKYAALDLCYTVAECRTFVAEVADLFRLHYAFFETRKIDWERAVAAAVAACDSYKGNNSNDGSLTTAELFEIAAVLLEQTGDAHVTLQQPGRGGLCFCAAPPIPSIVGRSWPPEGCELAADRSAESDARENAARANAIAIIEQRYLCGRWQVGVGPGVLVWGWLNRSCGLAYLLIKAMHPGKDDPEDVSTGEFTMPILIQHVILYLLQLNP